MLGFHCSASSRLLQLSKGPPDLSTRRSNQQVYKARSSGEVNVCLHACLRKMIYIYIYVHLPPALPTLSSLAANSNLDEQVLEQGVWGLQPNPAACTRVAADPQKTIL